ncbi:MAG TPA: S4 domain-containing protein [Steroidobacteraceae bacterium]
MVTSPVARAAGAERVQKVLAQLGLASRREAESWIRAGRLTVNGKPAELGMRVLPHDLLKLDGRPIRARRVRAASTPVFLCHRSPGEPLLSPRGSLGTPARAGGFGTSMAARLPRRAGLRFISISPMPAVDGGLELLTADGALAARLQRAMRGKEMEFSLRVRGELTAEQQQAIRQGVLDRGTAIQVLLLEPSGGEASNRWYRLIAVGASGNEVRQLIERAAVTLVRVLRTRVGTLELPRTLPRSHWRELAGEEISGVLDSPGSGR